MREIKFRAWDKKKKVWLHDFRLHPYGMVMVCEKARGVFWKYELSRKKAKNVVLVQYTGLKDKSGKEIYEGDIVELGEASMTADPLDPQNSIETAEVVMYVGKTLQPHFKDISDRFGKAFLTSRQVKKVIGNIYENPKLLEEVS